MMDFLIKQEIKRNSIKRLNEIYKEWLNKKQKAVDEPITAQELAEFFEYINNVLWDRW